MNFLAHIYLASYSDPAMIGALLGDFAKADVKSRYPPEIACEIMLHRRIDSYTDSHPVVHEALSLFPPPRRRFAGIVLDVFYDHMLSRRWAAYCDVPRADFIRRFYAALQDYDAILPERLREIVPSMIRRDWLGGYDDMEGVTWAVTRMSQRLSKNGALLLGALEDVGQHYNALALSFDAFFPDLIAFVAAHRRTLITAHLPRRELNL